jgi:type IV pilus assembly protein PilC
LFLALSVVVTVLFVFVMPRFIAMYAGLDADLPLPTKLLMEFVESLHIYTPVGLVAILSSWFLINMYIATENGKYRFYYFKTRIPLLGDINSLYLYSNMARTLSALLSSGATMVESLTSTIESLDNEWYKRRLNSAKKRLIEGASLSSSFHVDKLLPSTCIKMVEAGEASGRLEEILEEIANYYEEKLDYKVSRITSLIEPLMMLVIGIFVGGIIVVMYLPIFSIASAIK